MTKDLTGTVALITGASSGIGEASALTLAARGAAVGIVARRASRLEDLAGRIRAQGGTAIPITADISDRQQAEQAVRELIEQTGRLDILVNNAGLMRVGPFGGADVDEWEAMIATNLHGLLYITNAALPHLKVAAADQVRGVADIVNISSTAGRVASENFGVYNMTKFGINGFSESVRQELLSHKVRVGVLEPGAVETELNEHSTGSDEARAEIRTSIVELFAQIRALAPQDIADGVEFMVTRPAHTAVGELWIMPTDQV